MARLFNLFFWASVRDVSSSCVVIEVQVLEFLVLFLVNNLTSQCVPSTRQIGRAT